MGRLFDLVHERDGPCTCTPSWTCKGCAWLNDLETLTDAERDATIAAAFGEPHPERVFRAPAVVSA